MTISYVPRRTPTPKHTVHSPADSTHASGHASRRSRHPAPRRPRGRSPSETRGPAHLHGAFTTMSMSSVKISPWPKDRNSLYSSGVTRVCAA